jgi:hypothetical protein
MGKACSCSCRPLLACLTLSYCSTATLTAPAAVHSLTAVVCILYGACGSVRVSYSKGKGCVCVWRSACHASDDAVRQLSQHNSPQK